MQVRPPTSVMFAIIGIALAPGCTSARLERSTVAQAGTLTDIQYQQVLDNLAMFCKNPGALPWHVNISDGSAQIADLGSAQVMLDWHRAVTTHPLLLGSRTVVEQWGMNPVTDDTELKVLRIAYRRAVGFDESLSGENHDNGPADELAHELKKQTQDLDEFTDEINRHVAEARARYLNYQMKNLGFAGLFSPSKLADIFFPYKFIYGDEKREPIGDPRTTDGVPYFQLFDKIVSVTDQRIVLPGEVVSDDDEEYVDPAGKHRKRPVFFNYSISDRLSSLPTDNSLHTEKRYATPLAAEVRRQVKDVQSDLLKIHTGWFHKGRKKDVPKDACYVGHYRDCYVWVNADQVERADELYAQDSQYRYPRSAAQPVHHTGPEIHAGECFSGALTQWLMRSSRSRRTGLARTAKCYLDTTLAHRTRRFTARMCAASFLGSSTIAWMAASRDLRSHSITGSPGTR